MLWEVVKPLGEKVVKPQGGKVVKPKVEKVNFGKARRRFSCSSAKNDVVFIANEK